MQASPEDARNIEAGHAEVGGIHEVLALDQEVAAVPAGSAEHGALDLVVGHLATMIRSSKICACVNHDISSILFIVSIVNSGTSFILTFLSLNACVYANG